MALIDNKLDVVCCFCGEALDVNEATILFMYSNADSEVGQQLFCHRKHLIEKLDKSIILYVDDL